MSNDDPPSDLDPLCRGLARSPFPIVLTDAELRVLYANPPACALLGLTSEGVGWLRETGGGVDGEHRALDLRWDERRSDEQAGWFRLAVPEQPGAQGAEGAGALSGSSIWARLGSDPAATRPRDVVPLSHREREVIGLVADGLHTEEIAERLALSPETIKSHVRNTMTKLRAHTRSQAVAIALTTGEVAYTAGSFSGR